MAIPKLHLCHTLKNLYRDRRVYFYPGIGERLPFIAKWFDVVNSTMVLEHTKGPSDVLAEMIRVGKTVTGIIHQDDQVSSPYHSWHITDEYIVGLIEPFKRDRWINE